jgi:hypothetical protein
VAGHGGRGLGRHQAALNGAGFHTRHVDAGPVVRQLDAQAVAQLRGA